MNTLSPIGNVITIDDERIKNHLDRVVRNTVEETLNGLLDAEADRLCNARNEARWIRELAIMNVTRRPKAGEVRLKVPKLRQQAFETTKRYLVSARMPRSTRRAGVHSSSTSKRGLKGIRLIVSDACLGIAESAAEFFPEADWQRCVVLVPQHLQSCASKVREIAATLKAIHASEDIAAAREKAARAIEKLRGLRPTKAAELVETVVEKMLT
jgi:transposase-like protein